MNERIKELALKAGGSHYPTVGGENLEKFATLIIQEAILAVETKTNTHHAYTTFDHDLIQATITKSARAIREHFGVDQ